MIIIILIIKRRNVQKGVRERSSTLQVFFKCFGFTTGHSISISSGECNWSGVKAARASGSYYNKKYIIRVKTMRCYLEKTLGAATTGTQSDFSVSIELTWGQLLVAVLILLQVSSPSL